MKLELKHLAPYLPYGLKINAIKNAENNNIFELVGLSAGSSCFAIECRSIISGYEHEFISYNEDIKPILRPLSDLTKEQLREQGFDSHIDFLTHEKGSPIGCMGEYSWKAGAPYEMVEYLFSQHFDVFELIPEGLAIDINTLKL